MDDFDADYWYLNQQRIVNKNKNKIKTEIKMLKTDLMVK
jgi:hypothetical protein